MKEVNMNSFMSGFKKGFKEVFGNLNWTFIMLIFVSQLFYWTGIHEGRNDIRKQAVYHNCATAEMSLPAEDD